jgi:vitamin B12 transporter
VKAFYRYDALTYNDPAYPPESVHRTQTASLDATQKFQASDQVALVYGASGSFDYADSTNFSAPKNRLNLAGFLSVPWSPLESLTVTPSLRYDYFNDFAGSIGYSLGAVLRLSEESSLRASAGSSYRVPTLNDLYWYDPTGFTAANPNLKPETSYEGEVGWSLVHQDLSFGASVFTRLVVNNIVWLAPPPLYVYQPQNLTRTLFPGAELHAKAKLSETLSLDASYTFLPSFVLNDGSVDLSLADNRRVPFAPLHSLALQGRYDDKASSFGVQLRYVSQEFVDTANTVASALPAYFVADMDYRCTVTENFKFSLALKNIFNALYYTQSGYPMPPFSIETGVSVKL